MFIELWNASATSSVICFFFFFILFALFWLLFYHGVNKLRKFPRGLRLSWGRWGRWRDWLQSSNQMLFRLQMAALLYLQASFPWFEWKSHAWKKCLPWARHALSALPSILSLCSWIYFTIHVFFKIATFTRSINNHPERYQLAVPAE